jgi:hypothetical protein
MRTRAQSLSSSMSWKLVLIMAFVAVAAVGATPAAAQPPQPVPAFAVSDTVWRVDLADGSRLIGRIVAVDDTRITIETDAGIRVQVDRAQIRSAQPLRGAVVDGRHWADDPNHSRLMFGPTARPVGGGAGYFGVFELFFPYVAFGVTDQFTLAGGTAVGPEITGEVFYLAPKLTVVNRPEFAAAVGVLAFFVTRALDEGSVGLLYGVGTTGQPDRSLSFGIGFPFWTQGDDPIASDPVLMIGGEMRTGQYTKLLTENYILPTEGAGVISVGMRFFGERLSADAGLGLAIGDGDTFCCLPLVNFVYSFGRQR